MKNSAILWLSLMAIAILGSGGGICYYFCRAHKLGMSEGDRCPDRPGFPPSTCTKSEICTTLNEYNNLADNVEGCGFYPPYGKELICCPDQLPPPEVASEKQHDYNFLGSVVYIEPVKMDEFVYRYTALLISRTHALTTILTQNQPSLPLRILLGSLDPRVEIVENEEMPIQKTHRKNDELTIFEFDKQISDNQLQNNVSIAKFCDKEDFSNYKAISAIGFAQYPENGTSCSIFKKNLHLVDFNKCRNVINKNNVEGITSSEHLCLTPEAEYWTPWQDKRCLSCLTATSSVLQVKRFDGSYCVGGIATPTTDDCVISHDPLYYTILSKSIIERFLNIN